MQGEGADAQRSALSDEQGHRPPLDGGTVFFCP